MRKILSLLLSISLASSVFSAATSGRNGILNGFLQSDLDAVNHKILNLDITGSGLQPLDADLTSLASASQTNALYYRISSGVWGPVTIGSSLSFTGGTLDGNVLSNTIYIDPAGTSGGIRGTTKPFATLAQAIAVAQSGDRIVWNPGSYTPSSGATTIAQNNLTISAYGVVLNSTSQSDVQKILITGSGVIINGLTIDGKWTNGARTQNTGLITILGANCTLRDIYIHHGSAHGVYTQQDYSGLKILDSRFENNNIGIAGALYGSTSTGIQISRCTVQNNGLKGIGFGAQVGNTAALREVQITNNIVRNNPDSITGGDIGSVTLVSGSPVITSSGAFTSTMVGMTITAASGIPANTFISGFTDISHIVMSQNATANITETVSLPRPIGIELFQCGDGSMIGGNYVAGSLFGISAGGTNRTSIDNNIVRIGNGLGIEMIGQYISAHNNVIYGTDETGVMRLGSAYSLTNFGTDYYIDGGAILNTRAAVRGFTAGQTTIRNLYIRPDSSVALSVILWQFSGTLTVENCRFDIGNNSDRVIDASQNGGDITNGIFFRNNDVNVTTGTSLQSIYSLASGTWNNVYIDGTRTNVTSCVDGFIYTPGATVNSPIYSNNFPFSPTATIGFPNNQITNGIRLNIRGVAITGEGDTNDMGTFLNTTSFGAGVGSSIRFMGEYQTGLYVGFGSVGAVKENGISGNYAGRLRLLSRPNGLNETEFASLSPTGGFNVDSTYVNPGFGNIRAVGLGNSGFVETNSDHTLITQNGAQFKVDLFGAVQTGDIGTGLVTEGLFSGTPTFNAANLTGTAPIGVIPVGTSSTTVAAGNDARFKFTGTGSPEGVVTAAVGAIYTRTDGGAGTTLYVKESGAGNNTGWVAK